MRSLDALLIASETDPTATARAIHDVGGRVIGFLSADTPVELILAADAFPLQLPAGSPGPTQRADLYLEVSFLPSERAIAERWLRGEFDFVDAVVFSRAMDSSQRLYYYLCELQRRGLAGGPVPLLYDLPKIPRISSADYAHSATQRLALLLGSQQSKLRESIAIRNQRRELLDRIQVLRQRNTPPPGVMIERISRASERCPVQEFDLALMQWLDHVSEHCAGPRIILAGNTPPDGRLHAAVEQGGGCVVAECGTHSMQRLGPAIALDNDPIRALSRHYHSLPHGSRAFGDPAADLLEQVRANHAHGVIIWLVEEEEALGWELPKQLQLMEVHSVPVLGLTRCQWDSGADVLDNVRRFAAELRTTS